MAFDMTPPIETPEEILDTIAVCEEFLADAAELAGKAGPFNHIFSDDAIAFAKGQIAFERAKLAKLEA